jgi:hypothetical protein
VLEEIGSNHWSACWRSEDLGAAAVNILGGSEFADDEDSAGD